MFDSHGHCLPRNTFPTWLPVPGTSGAGSCGPGNISSGHREEWPMLLTEGILHQLIWRISHFSESLIDNNRNASCNHYPTIHNNKWKLWTASTFSSWAKQRSKMEWTTLRKDLYMWTIWGRFHPIFFKYNRWCRISSINSTALSIPIHVLKKPLYKGFDETNTTTTNAYMNILITASTRMLVPEIDPPVLRTSASFHTLSHLGSANIMWNPVRCHSKLAYNRPWQKVMASFCMTVVKYQLWK